MPMYFCMFDFFFFLQLVSFVVKEKEKGNSGMIVQRLCQVKNLVIEIQGAGRSRQGEQV